MFRKFSTYFLFLCFLINSIGYCFGDSNVEDDCILDFVRYNETYPLTPPRIVGSRFSFKVALIADLESRARLPFDRYKSKLRFGRLTINLRSLKVNFRLFSRKQRLISIYSAGGSGAHFSDLVVYDGKLLTCDRSTGIVFIIENDGTLTPWIILANGNGRSVHRGFRCEWMTVKDNQLFVGSSGVAFKTFNGTWNTNQTYVKRVNVKGLVYHLEWLKRYEKLREVAKIHPDDTLRHEAVVFDKDSSRWTFLPFVEVIGPIRPKPRQSNNLLLTADRFFHKLDRKKLRLSGRREYFSSVKVIPGLFEYLPEDIKSIAVGLRVLKTLRKLHTSIVVFTLPGREILLEDQWIANEKFTGIEFV